MRRKERGRGRERERTKERDTGGVQWASPVSIALQYSAQQWSSLMYTVYSVCYILSCFPLPLLKRERGEKRVVGHCPSPQAAPYPSLLLPTPFPALSLSISPLQQPLFSLRRLPPAVCHVAHHRDAPAAERAAGAPRRRRQRRDPPARGPRAHQRRRGRVRLKGMAVGEERRLQREREEERKDGRRSLCCRQEEKPSADHPRLKYREQHTHTHHTHTHTYIHTYTYTYTYILSLFSVHPLKKSKKEPLPLSPFCPFSPFSPFLSLFPLSSLKVRNA